MSDQRQKWTSQSERRNRGPGYYRNALKRTLKRYDDGQVGADVLANEVERYLRETERKNRGQFVNFT